MKLRRMGVVLVVLSLACLLALPALADSPKYVFLFIGDGTGTVQRMTTDAYLKSQGHEGLLMNTFPAYGVTTTSSSNSFITDSAAAGTALACGAKTNSGVIGMDPDQNVLTNISEKAKEAGMKVGIVSSVSIDHATPASFYAHQPSRNLYHEISVDLAKSGFDYFGGGGIKDPEGKKSKNPLGNALEMAKENGYTIVTDKDAFMALTPDAGKVLAYNARLDGAERCITTLIHWIRILRWLNSLRRGLSC